MNKILIIIAVVLLIVTVAVLYYTITIQTQSSFFLPQKQTEAPTTSQTKEATRTGESTSSSQR